MADDPNTDIPGPAQANISPSAPLQTANQPLGGSSAPAAGQEQMHRTTVWLAYITTIGFFSLIAILIVLDRTSISGQNPPNSPYRDILLTLMGIVGTAWAGIISFYFGSSVGARTQSDTLQQISRNAAVSRTDDH